MSATSSWPALDSRGVDVEQLTLDVDAPIRSRPASGEVGPHRAPPVAVAGRVLRPTAVFDTYWRFAAERQGLYEARLRGQAEAVDHRSRSCGGIASRTATGQQTGSAST